MIPGIGILIERLLQSCAQLIFEYAVAAGDPSSENQKRVVGRGSYNIAKALELPGLVEKCIQRIGGKVPARGARQLHDLDRA